MRYNDMGYNDEVYNDMGYNDVEYKDAGYGDLPPSPESE